MLQRAMGIVSSIAIWLPMAMIASSPSGSEAGNGSGHSRGLGGPSFSSAVGMSPTPRLSSRPGTSKQSLIYLQFLFCFVLFCFVVVKCSSGHSDLSLSFLQGSQVHAVVLCHPSMM